MKYAVHIVAVASDAPHHVRRGGVSQRGPGPDRSANKAGTPMPEFTEPYGFSNNVRGFLGPPDFEEAIMEVNAGDKAVRIALIYHDLTGTYDEEPK
jgi:hypothetical protein